MKYYVREIPYEAQMRGAWGKAREDINTILSSMDFTPLDIHQGNHSGIYRYTRNLKYLKVWKDTLSHLRTEDTLVVQYPPLENTVFLGNCLQSISRRGVRIILIIHDIVTRVTEETLKKCVYSVSEPQVFKSATKLIVHNERMKRQVTLDKSKMVSLGIFDYLMPDYQQNRMNRSNVKKGFPIIVAGNLSPRKTQYLYHLPSDCEFNLYGIGYQEDDRKFINYKGVYPPDELPYVLCGSFGLVWDGDSAETCAGKFGDYLRINNPHKTSLYLACGIPVIIWEQAAMADFILENECGLTVNSLYEIAPTIMRLSDDEYKRMRENAYKVGERIRNGYYLKTAIGRCRDEEQ